MNTTAPIKRMPVDVVIPLGQGSCHDNLELRMALRSIARYGCNIGTVFLVTETLPTWCQNVRHVSVPDRHTANKDANLIDKVLAACRRPELANRFLFWSDDQLALRSFDAASLVPVYNDRAAGDFAKNGIWHARMRNTFRFLETRRIHLNWNWDSHVPQLMEKASFQELLSTVDYAATPGYCINTLYFGLRQVKPFLEQSAIKVTAESAKSWTALPENKLFLGYNDAGLEAGLIKLLYERFPEPCRYEKI